MHKALLLLGLLRRGPRSGYDLHRIVRTHGTLYNDLKKANLYYLLDRLAREGYLEVRAEPGAPGPRGERLVYALTERGRARFDELLRAEVRHYEPAHTGIDVATMFLARVPRAEAIELLEERRAQVVTYQEQVATELSGMLASPALPGLAVDHLLTLIAAELAWVDRALARLRDPAWGYEPDAAAAHPHPEGATPRDDH
ncbi:MAG TPA: PadR family transcriptional regulator [Thermomicrobiales bacterium]|nr:PadR family transcriptional regulator [Thermomicrobiales bacterium]